MKFDSVDHETADIALVNGAGRPPDSTVTSITARRPKPELVVAHWGTMFEAVTMTLRRSVGGRLLSNGPLQHASLEARGQVLQCVDALDQLRTSMLEQIARTCAHEAELRAALALATAELANAHANAETARHEAAHDGLTSLPNRASFKARLAELLTQAASRKQSFALFYIDLDGFKQINDTTGTPPAISCCASSRRGWRVRCARKTWSAGSAVTSSPACSGTRRPGARP